MKYLATMTDHKWVSAIDTKKKKRNDKQNILWDIVFDVFLVSIIKLWLIYMLQVWQRNWTFLIGCSTMRFQRELYVELRCYTWVIDWLTGKCVALQFNAYRKWASWSPAGKGLTSWLSFVVSSVSLSLSHWYPGSGVVLDCIDSWSLQPYLLWLDFRNSRWKTNAYYVRFQCVFNGNSTRTNRWAVV